MCSNKIDLILFKIVKNKKKTILQIRKSWLWIFKRLFENRRDSIYISEWDK